MKIFCGMRSYSIVIMIMIAGCASPDKENSVPEQKDWYESREWMQGLTLNPHETIDREQLKRQYEANPGVWQTAFRFLRDSNLNALKPGKHLIDSNRVFVLVTDGTPAKDTAKPHWEAHEKYADIHYVVKGKEMIGLAPVSTGKLAIPYDESKDIVFYNASGKLYEADTSTFFVIFPGVAHCPQIKIDGYDSVKKVVVKVSLAPDNNKKSTDSL